MTIILNRPVPPMVETDSIVKRAVDVLVDVLRGDVPTATCVVGDLGTRLGVGGLAIDPTTSVSEQIAVLVHEINRVRRTDTVPRGVPDLHGELGCIIAFAEVGDPALIVPWLIRGLMKHYDLRWDVVIGG